MKLAKLALSYLASSLVSLGVVSSSMAQIRLPNPFPKTTRQMLFIGESRGVKVYIDPQKISRRLPFVRFWVYAVLPRPNSRRVNSLDTMMGIDCTIGSVRIYEIIRYDSSGEVVSNTSFGMERPPDTLEILGEFDRNIFSTVCNQPKSAPI